MTRILLYAAAFGIGLSCTHQKANDDLPPPTGVKGYDPFIPVRRSLSDVPINVSRFCNNKASNCAIQLSQLQAQLMVEDPVPVPQSTIGATISTEEAVQRYKQFVANHPGEPVLDVFKQLYPRILLDKYGLLASEKYSLILYFTQQLIDAGSLDLSIQTRALIALKGHVPDVTYTRLLSTVLADAKAYQIGHEQVLARLTAEAKEQQSTNKKFSQRVHQQIVDHYEETTKMLVVNIAKLRQLQRG